jgi:hypothetical protein
MEQGELERYELDAVRVTGLCVLVRQCFLKVIFFAGILGCLLGRSVLSAHVPKSTNDLIAAMLSHEDYDASHRGHFSYLSNERSDRTDGHLWTEKIVETTAGKLRMLVAEDGQPLSGDRAAAEKARLAFLKPRDYAEYLASAERLPFHLLRILPANEMRATLVEKSNITNRQVRLFDSQ